MHVTDSNANLIKDEPIKVVLIVAAIGAALTALGGLMNRPRANVERTPAIASPLRLIAARPQLRADHAEKCAALVAIETAPMSGTNHDVPIGAHLVTLRRGYSHHGIYVGEGKVVHYAGLSLGIHRGPVEEVSLADFAGGREVTIKSDTDARFSAAEVSARARSRLGEDRYRLITNNCEHFCEWCIRGEARSEQIEKFYAWPRRVMSFAHAVLRQIAATATHDMPDKTCAA